jgi:hypothetical protein
VEQKVDHRAKQGIEKDDVGYGLTVREVDWNEKRTKKKEELNHEAASRGAVFWLRCKSQYLVILIF